MISIINYGLGNISAFANIYRSLGIQHCIASTPDDLLTASHLILPGVGSFDWAMQKLDASGMRPMLDDLVLSKRIPVLGICVGMQMMANSSEEGNSSGLGWISGHVRRFDSSLFSSRTALPHMGWNNILINPNPLFNTVLDKSFYFLHSYHFDPSSRDYIIAEAEYGLRFSAAINNQNIYGVQFHPEKSHISGVKILENFASL